MEWNINRGEQRCAACERVFQEDEEYISTVVDQGLEFERKDYCTGCWSDDLGAGSFSFWRTRVPLKQEEDKKFVDDEVIFNFFQRMEGQSDPLKQNFRYVLGLFLMRKRMLKFRDVERTDEGEFLVLYVPRDKSEHSVFIPNLTEEQIVQVTEDVGQILNVQL